MGHSVQLIIGKDEPVALFLGQWPGARAIELSGGWRAIPVDAALYNAIEAANPGAARLPELDVAPLGVGNALMAATSHGGALAYVETDYHGGMGSQCAIAILDGRERMAPQRARGIGPINQALRAIGVEREGGQDEFDTIGLNERRSMSDYEPEGLAPPRADPPPAAPTRPDQPTLPMWLVMIFIAVAVGVGIMISIVR